MRPPNKSSVYIPCLGVDAPVQGCGADFGFAHPAQGWLQENLADPEFSRCYYGFRIRSRRSGPRYTRTDNRRHQRELFLAIDWPHTDPTRLRVLVEAGE